MRGPPLTPNNTSSLEVSPHYALGQGASMLQYSPESLFWLCNRIAQFAYLRYNRIGAEVREIIDRHENACLTEIPSGPKSQRIMGKGSAGSLPFPDRLFTASADVLFKRWQQLDIYLLVKYIDGNTKQQNPDGSFMHNAYSDSIPVGPVQEGYNQRWKEAVVKDTGNKLLEP
jgi:hypothetical protein